MGFEPAVLDEFVRERTAALVGQNLMRNHGRQVGDTATLRDGSNTLDIRSQLVVELPARDYPNFFMFHRDYLVDPEKARGISEDERPASLRVTPVDRIGNVPKVIRKIDSTFHNSVFETATMTESEAVAGLLPRSGTSARYCTPCFAVVLRP